MIRLLAGIVKANLSFPATLKSTYRQNGERIEEYS
jgi:hypothetical protein